MTITTVTARNLMDVTKGELVMHIIQNVDAYELKNAVIKALIDHGKYAEVHEILKGIIPVNSRNDEIHDESWPA